MRLLIWLLCDATDIDINAGVSEIAKSISNCIVPETIIDISNTYVKIIHMSTIFE